jgi:hypothetical protein
MTRKFLTATAIAIAMAGSAAAANAAGDLFQHELSVFAPGTDASGLSDAQVNALKLVIHSGAPDAKVRAEIRAIVNA